MKVVGLINRIYEGTQPKHIRVYNEDWYWNNYDGYVTKESLKTTPDAQTYLFDRYRLMFALDKEVEVLEEEEDKDIPLIPDDELWNIEHINICGVDRNNAIDYNFKVLKEKINQVVEEMNRRNDASSK